MNTNEMVSRYIGLYTKYQIQFVLEVGVLFQLMSNEAIWDISLTNAICNTHF